MTLQEIENTLIKGVASITARDAESVPAGVPLHNIGVDSLGLVELLVFIEKTFKLKLIELDLTKKDFETIHSLASFISGKLQ